MSGAGLGHYERAWPLDESGESVLVACGSAKNPYWWVLCPAAATLYTDEIEDGEGSCSIGIECDFPEIHTMARKTWERVSG